MNIKDQIIINSYERVKNGNPINREEALLLYKQPLEELCEAANAIRRHFCVKDPLRL